MLEKGQKSKNTKQWRSDIDALNLIESKGFRTGDLLGLKTWRYPYYKRA